MGFLQGLGMKINFRRGFLWGLWNTNHWKGFCRVLEWITNLSGRGFLRGLRMKHQPLEGVFCRVLESTAWPTVAGEEGSLSPPFTLRFTGLRDGAFGREGREGFTCGGPGTVSSITWVQAFRILWRSRWQAEEDYKYRQQAEKDYKYRQQAEELDYKWMQAFRILWRSRQQAEED